MSEQHDREVAASIAATFYSGRDGVGPVKLFETAELVRAYIEHGEEHVLPVRSRKAVRSRSR